MLSTTASRSTAPAAGLLALVLALSGCAIDTTPARAVAAEPRAVAPSAPSLTSSPVPSSPVPSSPATSSPATSSPAPSSPAPAAPSAGPSGSATTTAVDLAAVQRRLEELRYYDGAVDGRSGPAMRSAVMAFQKVNGLAVDGAVGPRTLEALARPRAPQLRASSPADRVEVDLDRQVLYVVEDAEVVRILPVSSGDGAAYREKDGTLARALTPVGTYRIERRIVGVRNAALGTLYDPQYFYRGWAIHGSDSVPAGPASHGCVRVTRADAKYLLSAIGVGTTVHLYGGQHVFSAGSRAAGTSAPAGDAVAPTPREVPAKRAPAPTAFPAATAPAATPSPSAAP